MFQESSASRSKLMRAERLKAANLKGTHTRKEWLIMREFFDYTCAKCFGESGLINVEKDHIIPLYMGGSNGLDNLQPLCALCNIRKTSDCTDYRPSLAAHLHKKLPTSYKAKRRLNG